MHTPYVEISELMIYMGLGARLSIEQFFCRSLDFPVITIGNQI